MESTQVIAIALLYQVLAIKCIALFNQEGGSGLGCSV